MASQPDQTVLVTGAAGFVGSYVCRYLAARGFMPRPLVRTPSALPDLPGAVVLDLAGGEADLAPALAGAGTVVHLAGIAHRATGSAADELALYRAINRDATVRLARAAAAADVRHFVFASTVYVHGHRTAPGERIHAGSPLVPHGAYATSKAEAEEALAGIASETGLRLTIIRPSVVYGPDPKANIRALAGAVRRGLPLPFGAIANERSFLGIENLASFIVHRLEAGLNAPPGREAFVLADDEIVSTPEFVRRLATALGTTPRLLPVPPGLLRALLKALGRGAMAESLIDSFAVDITAARQTGWRPAVSLDRGLADMVAARAGSRISTTG